MRFAPFAALAAVASALLVMAAPVAVPATLDVRAPETITVRALPTVNQVLAKLKTDVAGPIATLNGLNANTISSAIVVQESNKIYTALDTAVVQLISLQSIGDLNLLFGLLGWVNSVLSVTGISLDTLAALAHLEPLLKGGNLYAESQPSIERAAARDSDLFYNFIGLFNGLLGALLTPVIGLLTSSLKGNLEPLLAILGPVTYQVFKLTSGLVYLLATDP